LPTVLAPAGFFPRKAEEKRLPTSRTGEIGIPGSAAKLPIQNSIPLPKGWKLVLGRYGEL